MSKYTDPVCKLCRREGEKLFLKGQRCYTPKCAFERRGFPPGEHSNHSGKRRNRARLLAQWQRLMQLAERHMSAGQVELRKRYGRLCLRQPCSGGPLARGVAARRACISSH